jgi:hypothetical protein
MVALTGAPIVRRASGWHAELADPLGAAGASR